MKITIILAAFFASAACAGPMLDAVPLYPKDECPPAVPAPKPATYSQATTVSCDYASIRAAVTMRKLAPTSALIEVVAGCGPNEAAAHSAKLQKEGVK
jgi:hypothetical protein